MAERVVVGMSGGVDSAVAALLLKRQGYDVLGVFMNNWQERDEDGVCTAQQDFDVVRRVCDQIGIPYFAVNYQQQYLDRVFTHFLSEYAAGRTPNPDVLCNREIKFKELLDFALKTDARFLATGHYARVDQRGGEYAMLKGIDSTKDQSYFLYTLGQSQLARVLFPLGGLLKKQVRAIAAEAGLGNAARRDSTGICFIGERDFKAFLSRYLPARPGDIRELGSGRLLGRHEGLMYYTLGQRRGLGVGGRKEAADQPWFVAGKDLDDNVLWAVQGHGHPALLSRGCLVSDISWVDGEGPGESVRTMAKIRYRQADQAALLTPEEGGLWRVEFDEPQRAVTPGQSAVFYHGDRCLGGGIISKMF